MAEFVSSVPLNNGGRVPCVGLGTWKLPREVAAGIVEEAIKMGYRHIDCACDYGNELEVGRGISNAIKAGFCKREDLFITSKLWNTYHSEKNVQNALFRSLSDLGLAYVDMYMIHFPISLKYVPFEKRYPPGWTYDPENKYEGMNRIILEHSPLHRTWAALENQVEKGYVKYIGVCNFNVALLMDLLSYARVKPSMLQVEMHPRLLQDKLLEFCRSQAIAVTAFSPFGSVGYVELNMDKGHASNILQEPVICQVAERLERSAAQILLRWAVQRGVCVIPKTSRKDRLEENLNVFDFAITTDDMKAINGIQGDRSVRYNDPGEFCSEMGLALPIYA